MIRYSDYGLTGFPTAFDDLMTISSLVSQPSFSPLLAKCRNKKQLLRKVLISYLSKKGLNWHSGQVSSSREAYLKDMVDRILEIDGQHYVFNCRNFPIPLVLVPLPGITSQNCRRIACVKNKTCPQHRFVFVLIVSLDACRESTGIEVVGKSSNRMLNFLQARYPAIVITWRDLVVL